MGKKDNGGEYLSPRSSGEVKTILGRGSAFEGKLTFEGTLRIDGKFKGEIFTEDTLVVGEGAEVQAEIDVSTVVINGNVDGNIRAKHSVEVHAPGRLRGMIYTPSLYVERGVVFEGSCQMENLSDVFTKHEEALQRGGVFSLPGESATPGAGISGRDQLDNPKPS